MGALFAIYSDPSAMRYWSSPPSPDLSVTKSTLDWLIAHNPLTYFVWEHSDGVISAGGLYEGDEIGFILSPKYWRHGFGAKALTATISYLFETSDLPQLTADADPRNAASVGLLKHLGFLVTGTAQNTFFVNDEWSDSVYLALKRPDATP